MQTHAYRAGVQATRDGRSVVVCRVCGHGEDLHTVEPIPETPQAARWDRQQMRADETGKRRRPPDWLQSRSLRWRIRRGIQVWGRQ